MRKYRTLNEFIDSLKVVSPSFGNDRVISIGWSNDGHHVITLKAEAGSETSLRIPMYQDEDDD